MKQIYGFIFGLGVGGSLGVFTTRKLLKKKYEKLADEEIESVKKAFKERLNSEKIPEEEIHEKPLGPKDFSGEENKEYIDYSKQYRTQTGNDRITGTPSIKKKSAQEKIELKRPYQITGDEFNDSQYESKTLYYFSDKIVSDDVYNIINDPVSLLGPDALTQFGIHDEDVVYIRDDSLGIDYEVLLDERTYLKVKTKFPPKIKLQTDDEDN